MEIAASVAFVANHLGLLDAYAFMRRSLGKPQVAIIMYHRVFRRQNDWYSDGLDTEEFRRHLDYFCSEYEVISLDRLVELLNLGRSLPNKAVVITFDDGFYDNFLYAYPILLRNRIPATVFLTAGHIGNDQVLWQDRVRYAIVHTPLNRVEFEVLGSYDLTSSHNRSFARFDCVEKLKIMPTNKRNVLIDSLLLASRVSIPADLGQSLMLSWDNVREMSSNGVAFGAHTVSHPALSRLPLAEARQEILESKIIIEQALHKRVTSFAYPFGEAADFNNPVQELVREAGFDCAVTTIRDWVGPSSNVYALGRIGALEDFNKFKVMVSGLWPDIQRRLKRRL